jgi:peptidoglycan/LPS O-acetylase OafA/YrhL
MAGVLVFSLVLRVLIVYFDTSHKYLAHFLYFSTITRFDGFAVGALLALAFQSERWKGTVARFAWPVLGLMSVLVATIFITTGKLSPLEENYYLNTWGYTLIALASGALLTVITTGPAHSPFSMLFRSRALSFFGKYSYAMYLIHYPITLLLFKAMDFGPRDNLRIWLFFVVASFVLTILGSLLTWHLIEKPALKQKKYFESKAVESGAVAES